MKYTIDDLPRSILDLNPDLCKPAFSSYIMPEPCEKPSKQDEKDEKELQRLCELELGRRGIWFLHLSPRAREKTGTPDILACVNGIAFACELKSGSGRLSDDQKATLQQMTGNGWHTVVVRSMKQFVEELDKLGGKR